MWVNGIHGGQDLGLLWLQSDSKLMMPLTPPSSSACSFPTQASVKKAKRELQLNTYTGAHIPLRSVLPCFFFFQRLATSIWYKPFGLHLLLSVHFSNLVLSTCSLFFIYRIPKDSFAPVLRKMDSIYLAFLLFLCSGPNLVRGFFEREPGSLESILGWGYLDRFGADPTQELCFRFARSAGLWVLWRRWRFKVFNPQDGKKNHLSCCDLGVWLGLSVFWVMGSSMFPMTMPRSDLGWQFWDGLQMMGD